MKVLDLQCARQHSFEGWFASEDDFQTQLGGGMIECPLCADKNIHKLPSAPRLNLAHAAEPATAAIPAAAGSAGLSPPRNAAPAEGPSPQQQAQFLQALRQVMVNTEDVGERFADEARRMHYGDAEQRNIRGQASRRETVELLEEGIDVLPLPLPPALKETLQ